MTADKQCTFIIGDENNMASICAEMLYRDTEFYDRFEKIKADNADAVEFWRWANKDINKIKMLKETLDLKISGFCVDSEDEDRGNLILKNILTLGLKEEFLKALKETKKVYDMLGAEFVIVTLGDKIEDIPYEEQLKNIENCLEFVKLYLENNNMTLLLEPINPQERPDYIMSEATPVFELIKKLDSPNIKMLYDIYHQNMTGDFDLKEVIRNIDYIGHFHIADVPGRHEPGTGNIDYKKIFEEIVKTSYSGDFGYEFKPTDSFAINNWRQYKGEQE